ncbi:N-acetyltransferase [Gammaproteobacteria bacterium 2W06]|nr:N-acetyltransferase [Gammaproteobacteria bacterium 2W06]
MGKCDIGDSIQSVLFEYKPAKYQPVALSCQQSLRDINQPRVHSTMNDPLDPFQRYCRADQFGYSSRVVFLEQPVDSTTAWAEKARRWFPGVEDYLQAYHRVGNPWLWSDRLAQGRAAIARDLDNPDHRCWRLDQGGGLAGFCELILRRDGQAEILHCGLVPGARGQGLGQRLMGSALAGAQALGARRIWLHTCSEDSVAALGFYQRAGFRPFATRLEWVIDPRRRGLLGADAGDQVDLPWTGAQAVHAFSAAADAGSTASRAAETRPGS